MVASSLGKGQNQVFLIVTTHTGDSHLGLKRSECPGTIAEGSGIVYPQLPGNDIRTSSHMFTPSSVFWIVSGSSLSPPIGGKMATGIRTQLNNFST